MKKLFFILMLASSSYADTHYGMWGTTCDDDGFSINLTEKTTPLVINDNQIVISVHSKKVTDNSIGVFFDRVLDLGRGGMAFDWKYISHIKKIAEIKIKENNGIFIWNGFFDVKKNKYFWISDPDFVQFYAESGEIKLRKCD